MGVDVYYGNGGDWYGCLEVLFGIEEWIVRLQR